MRRPPFSGLLTDDLLLALQPLPEAAYLYDAIMLYAQALGEVLEAGEDPRKAIIYLSKTSGHEASLLLALVEGCKSVDGPL